MTDLRKATDRAVDLFEGLTSTQTTRTGYSAARVASALAKNVDADVVALQLTQKIAARIIQRPQ
jgi:hypothetical protein